MLKTQRFREVAFRLNRLSEADQVDEDAMTLEESYESLLDSCLEARDLNRELEEMIREYIQAYGHFRKTLRHRSSGNTRMVQTDDGMSF